jgi:transcription antitermination factor NusG
MEIHERYGAYPWFAVRIRARQERLIASALHNKGYEVFLPLYVSRRRWADRFKELELPLFPGYLFCRFDVQKRLPILMTPGVLQIVGTNNAPLPIEDVEIAAVQSIVLSGLAAEPWPYLRTGETVRIERGSLSGVEGILVAVKKPYRVVVSVTLLQRSVAVEIDQDWMSPVDQGETLRSGMAAELVATGA